MAYLPSVIGSAYNAFVENVRSQISGSSDIEGKIIELLTSRLVMSHEQCSTKWTRWNQVERDVWVEVDEKLTEERKAKNLPTFDKRIVLPVTHWHINARVRNLMQLLFKGRSLFPMWPRADSTKRIEVKKLQQWLDYQHQRNRNFAFGRSWLLSADMFGVGYRFTTWDFHREINDNRVADPFETYPDVRGAPLEPETWDFVGFQHRRSLRELIQQPHYFNEDRIKKMDGRTTFARVAWDVSADRFYGTNASTRSIRDSVQGLRRPVGKVDPHDGGTILLHEFWTWLIPSDYFDVSALVKLVEDAGGTVPDDWDPDAYQIWVFGMANGNTVCRAEPNPLPSPGLPVGVIAPLYDMLSIMPKGIGEMMQPIQEVCSWLISSRMHNVYQAINEQKIIDQAVIRMEDVESGEPVWRLSDEWAGQGYDTNRAVRVFTPSNVTATHWNDLERFLEILQRLTGATDPIQGIAEKVEQTLGQYEGLIGQAMGHIADTAELYYSMDFPQWAQQEIANTIAFMPEEVKVRMSVDLQRQFKVFREQKEQVLRREDLRDVLIDIEPFSPGGLQKKTAVMMVLRDMLQIFAQAPELQQKYPRAVEAITLMIADYADMPSPEQILSPEEELEEMVSPEEIADQEELADLRLVPGVEPELEVRSGA